MYPTTEDVRRSQQLQTQTNLVDVSSRLDEIKHRIQRVQQQQQTQQLLQKQQLDQQAQRQKWDWTKSYQDWSHYEDIDELRTKQHHEEAKLDSLLEKQNIMQHAHDHSKEKEFFMLPEEVKIRMCEENRQVGNYLFQQGTYTRAAERYQIAIAYYEYCFPEDEKVQEELDELRHACLCNVSLCYIRIGWYREAVEAASQVIKESHQKHAKAFYRRGQAYRYLDEYENSLRDLNKSLQLIPNDVKVLEEKSIVQHLMEGYRHQSTVFSQQVLDKADYHLDHNHRDHSIQQHADTLPPQGNTTTTTTPPHKIYERSISLFHDALPIEAVLPRTWQQVNLTIAGANL